MKKWILIIAVYSVLICGGGPLHHVEATSCIPNSFCTTWDTANPGLSDGDSITIPITGGGYNYTVDWGDGTSEADGISHQYDTPGIYTVSITGDFPRIYFYNTHSQNDRQKILSVEQWGTIHWLSMEGAFYSASHLVINATDAPDLSGVTDLSYMFESATSINQSLNNWDTSTVENMYSMFAGASSFNGDIHSWDTGQVTNMGSMLFGTAFDQSLADWDVQNVTSMDNILTGTELSVANYDDTLASWANQSLELSVSFGAGSSHYCSAASQRTSIISTYNWLIYDSGEQCPHSIEYYPGTGGTITPSGTFPLTVAYGATGPVVTAIPNSGYAFNKWSDNSTQNPRTDTNITQDISLTAQFVSTVTSPDILNASATNITKTSATLHGEIVDVGGENAYERGFLYLLTADLTPTPHNTHSVNETGNFGVGSFSERITDLLCDTSYSFATYAKNHLGGQGFDHTVGSFTTSSCGRNVIGATKNSSPVSNPKTSLGSGKCSSDLILSDPMAIGDRNNKRNSFSGRLVTQVTLLQKHVNRILAAKYTQASGPVDGVFGPLTKVGVQRLQAVLRDDLHLDLGPKGTDGVVGPFTREAINNSCGA